MKTLAVGLVIVAVLATAAVVGTQRAKLLCTSATSSIDASGHVVTEWQPKGCRHG